MNSYFSETHFIKYYYIFSHLMCKPPSGIKTMTFLLKRRGTIVRSDLKNLNLDKSVAIPILTSMLPKRQPMQMRGPSPKRSVIELGMIKRIMKVYTKRYVSHWMSFCDVFLRKSFWIKNIRVGIIFRIAMNTENVC